MKKNARYLYAVQNPSRQVSGLDLNLFSSAGEIVEYLKNCNKWVNENNFFVSASLLVFIAALSLLRFL